MILSQSTSTQLLIPKLIDISVEVVCCKEVVDERGRRGAGIKKPGMGGERGERSVMRADQAPQHKDDHSGNNRSRTKNTSDSGHRR